ncbi:hypothetical protein NAI39_11120, partial [Francisella tularensis subsp. holarctica]|nr:hypothetical protein [Francisella tularensis subsp. holarctica]
MKKLILTSILGFIFAAPAFSFDNPYDGSNSTKVTSNVTNMSNTVLRDAIVLQQTIPRDSMSIMQSHRQI